VLKSLILDLRWPENVFIIRGNSRLTTGFYGVLLGPAINQKIVSKSEISVNIIK